MADISLAYDREVKLLLRARFRIPEVWTIDLPTGAIELCTEPSEDGYGLVRRARKGASLISEALPELLLPVDAVVG